MLRKRIEEAVEKECMKKGGCVDSVGVYITLSDEEKEEYMEMDFEDFDYYVQSELDDKELFVIARFKKIEEESTMNKLDNEMEELERVRKDTTARLYKEENKLAYFNTMIECAKKEMTKAEKELSTIRNQVDSEIKRKYKQHYEAFGTMKAFDENDDELIHSYWSVCDEAERYFKAWTANKKYMYHTKCIEQNIQEMNKNKKSKKRCVAKLNNCWAYSLRKSKWYTL